MAAGKREVTSRYPVEVTIKRLKFTTSPSVAYLDLEKLAGARSAEVEVGSFKTPHSPRVVKAIVRKGLVTGLRVEGCADCQGPSFPLPSRFEKAVRRLGRPTKFRPMPVAKFFANIGVVVVGTGSSTGCIFISETLPDGRTINVVCCPDKNGRLGCATQIFKA